jgi:tetracycline 7-halogenase / FADH2 O2-dependent halogenase
MVDRQRHPRFAIGESSTPTADFLLAHLADRWGLKNLAPMACWGTWKEHHPEVVCGKKRGFSYYRHHPGKPFHEDQNHDHSLLVAASASDRWSDTHWLRSSVDRFLSDQAVSAGTQLLDQHRLAVAHYDPSERRWRVSLASHGEPNADSMPLTAEWMVDASGAGNALSEFVGNPPQQDWMRTKTQAVFAHFTGVAPFEVARSPDDPFCGDDAAQHHVLDRGWIWMLRFDNGVTSVGLVEPCQSDFSSREPSVHFQSCIARYPSVAGLLCEAHQITPQGQMGFMPRLSRCRTLAAGPGWALLPVTFGFVDPLHSSGIAHALSGVARIANALLSNREACIVQLQQYAQDLRSEVEWLDTLVAGCYAAQPSFSRFSAFASLYFVSAIQFEKQLAADPTQWSHGFMQCRDPLLRSVAEELYSLLMHSPAGTEASHDDFAARTQRAIEPWNTARLLDPAMRNRIAHSAAPKYAAIASQTAAPSCSGG